MGDIHSGQRRVELAMQRLDRSAIPKEDRALIKDFVNYKTAAQNVGAVRQDKYVRILVLCAERFLNGRTFSSLTGRM